MFMKDRYHLGQDQADALGYTRRSAAAQRREEEEALEDESNALLDQQMPLPEQHSWEPPPGITVPGLSVPGLMTASNGGGAAGFLSGVDISGLLQSFGMPPGLGGMGIPGMGKGPSLPMQNEAYSSERQQRSRGRGRDRSRSPDRWDSRDRDRDRDRDYRDGGRRERNGYGRR